MSRRAAHAAAPPPVLPALPVLPVLLACLALSACSGGENPAPGPSTTPLSATTTAPGPAPAGLIPGEPHTWDDDLSVSVEHATPLAGTAVPGDTADGSLGPFRIELTVTNDGDRPVDLDDLVVSVESAAGGASATPAYAADGTRALTGRLAPGTTERRTSDWSLGGRHTPELLVTVGYWHEEDTAGAAADPHWRVSLTPR